VEGVVRQVTLARCGATNDGRARRGITL